MGTLYCLWPYYQEEYPHRVTLTKPYYLAEIPVTQEIYEAVMGTNPSTVKDPQLPVRTRASTTSRSSVPFSQRRTRRPSVCLPMRNGSTQLG